MSFSGFDCDLYPGDGAMAALKADFAFCGFYLEAPSHRDAGWTGKRAHIVSIGFGIIPIFVGQQTFGPGSHKVTAEQGTIDGHACAAEMQREGFPLGSFVYLDLENGPPFAEPQIGYVKAWAQAVNEGKYGAGVYTSHHMAADVALAVPKARIWAVRIPTTARSTDAPPYPSDAPSGSGYAEAVAWQCRENVQITGEGYSLVVDLDTAVMPDPSSPYQSVVPPEAKPDPVALHTHPMPSAPISVTPPAPVTPAPVPMTTRAVQAAPPIAAGATAAATAAVGAAQAAGFHVNPQALIDALAPYVVTGLILPLVIWALGRAFQLMHLSIQSKAGQAVVAAVENAVNVEAAQGQAFLDANSSVAVNGAAVARVLTYVNQAVPQRLAASGIKPDQLAVLITNRLAQASTSGAPS